MFVGLLLLSSAAADFANGRESIAEYEVEDQKSSGVHVGPNLKPGSAAAEASGRRAVWLENPHQSITFKLHALVRSGSLDPHWQFGVGSIWLYALEKPIRARILIQHDRIEDAPCEAVQLLGPDSIEGVRIDGLRAVGSVLPVLALQTAGSLDAAGVVSEKTSRHPIVEVPRSFRLTIGPGNRGWQARRVAHADRPGCRSPSRAVAGRSSRCNARGTISRARSHLLPQA